MHVKLLSSEALSAQNAANIVQHRALPGAAGGAYSAPPDPLVGLRGYLVYHIRALASQSAIKCGFRNAPNVLGMTLPGPTG